jgi:DNA repair protein SbcC/Rad50
MIIKRIRLVNIRSYTDQTIEFKQGSTLLSGDIGSGKSSILLAIEFALFGITRGILSGSSLLRAGTSQGYIELDFTINNTQVTIKRALKLNKQDVRQEKGSITINNKTETLTPIELKTKVLELLGYPSILVTKSKSLIYRYTVYTPQEEIKRILLEQSDYRLDTLRKLFQIDKYRQIRENSLLIIRELKQQQSTLKGGISDLDEKKRQLNQFNKEIDEQNLIQKNANSELEKTIELVKQKKQNIKSSEKTLHKLTQLKSALASHESSLKEKVNSVSEHNSKIKTLTREIEELDNKSKKIEISDPGDERSIESQLDLLQQKKEAFIAKTAELNHTITNEQKEVQELINTTEKISNLNKCPLCKQEVTQNHIENINDQNSQAIKKSSNKIAQAEKSLENMRNDQKKIQKSILETRQKLKLINQQKIKQKELQNIKNMLSEKQKNLQSFVEKQSETKKQIGLINLEKQSLAKQIESLKNIETNHLQLKNSLESTLSKEKELTIISTKAKTKSEELNKIKTVLNYEIDKKTKAKTRLQKLSHIQNWMEKLFLNLMTTMEQHVMMRVYNEFNEIFQNFFNILLETESIAVRLDEEFTPIIEQNGHEITYVDLSGGEKTSIALAYRLALNKVVNDIVDNIKTDELIILDEPTDGFSTSQLDRLRDVLDILKSKQSILVSHEQKLESFVDNVLKVEKRDHVSQVI